MKRIVIGMVLGALLALSLATGASARTIGLGDLNQMLYPETLTTSACRTAGSCPAPTCRTGTGSPYLLRGT